VGGSSELHGFCYHSPHPIHVLISPSSAFFDRMKMFEPFTSMIFLFLKSLRIRVTVSLVVPIICAISSCVRSTTRRIPVDVYSPLLALQSRRSLASFSDVVWDKPRDRISRCADWYFTLSCCAVCIQAST
jgi:hypothetical protein